MTGMGYVPAGVAAAGGSEVAELPPPPHDALARMRRKAAPATKATRACRRLVPAIHDAPIAASERTPSVVHRMEFGSEFGGKLDVLPPGAVEMETFNGSGTDTDAAGENAHVAPAGRLDGHAKVTNPL